MRHFLTTLLVLATAIMAQAYDYPYLALQTTSGTVTQVATESLSLTISGTQLKATNNEGTQTFTLSELSCMYFVASATGINTIDLNQAGPVEVSTLTGASVGRYESLSAACSTLPAGVYIVQTQSNTLKIAVQ